MLLKTITIENFRGIEKLALQLDRTTVLIGENNTGKTSVLECLNLCLGRGGSRRSLPFGEYDYHLKSKDALPAEAAPLVVTLLFKEEAVDEWPEEISQGLEKTVQAPTDSLSEVRLQFKSHYDAKLKEYVFEWNFLDLKDKPLAANTRRFLSELQQFVPVFLLTAVRDAGQQFQSRSPFWGSFVRNLQMDDKDREDIEEQIEKINEAVIASHKPFEEVKDRLCQAASLVPLDPADSASVEAIPARVFDMLSRAQVKLAATTGAKLPIGQHGAGTQSLAVVFLFEAFLNAKLAEAYDKHSEPLLALEEPESHLHPSAIRALWKTLDGLKGQKLIATHSGDLLSAVPLQSIRRLAKRKGKVEAFSVGPGVLTPEEERTIAYTIRSHRGSLLFARCWLLVEGQSEFWFLPEAARSLNINFELDAIACIEFSQVKGKLAPLAKLANALGIEWHLLADGDAAGCTYVSAAKSLLNGVSASRRITQLSEPDLECALWKQGYSKAYEDSVSKAAKAGIKVASGDPQYPSQVIDAAIASLSKPELALLLASKVGEKSSPGLPKAIDTALRLVQQLSKEAK